MMISEKQRGLLFVLVGPGGAGKNTLMKPLLARIPNLYKLVTATTRPKRPNEVEEYDHYFIDENEFERMFAQGELLERQEVTPGRHYGIIKARVDEKLDNQHDLIADIEVRGATVLKEAYTDDAQLIFITVPGATMEEKLETLRLRMEERQDHPDEIEKRLTRARDIEFPFEAQCNTTIVNASLAEAEEQVYEFIKQCRKERGG